MLVLAIEVVVVGSLALYLLTVVPAGIVTAAKGNGRLLVWGFLSFGLSWYGGAAALAPPESRWARWRYDAEQRRRAELPIPRQRSRGVHLAWAAAVALAVLLVGLFIFRPAPVLGVDAEVLGNSVPGFAGCTHLEAGEYRCGIEPLDDIGSGAYPERVRVGSHGCWHVVTTPTDRLRGTRGCINLVNYLNPFGLER